MLCTILDVNMCSRIKGENDTQNVLLKMDVITKINCALCEINYDPSTTPKTINEHLDSVKKDQCKFMHDSNHHKTSKGYEMK